jgi:hypothetical protein
MTRTRLITSIVPPLPSARRLDSYCANRFTYLTKDQWREEIVNGKLTLDGETVIDPAIALKGGEILS